MIKANRKECRKKLAELLEQKLTVDNSFAGEVHAQPVKGFGSTPAIVVSTSGSARSQNTFNGLANVYYFAVETFITYPTPEDTTYTRETVEDSLDDIEAGIAEVVTENQVVQNYWESLAFLDRTEAVQIELDGTAYRFEQFTIEVS